ncbi:hypothetical protein [Actinomadura madurae]|uniref:hypothetical protein n=1 Tax=Actinomadura madurae TaxID=1993 RepID=UPI000D8E3ED5|nr:hypothetical protein [Actinomadura madurae]SPT51220.1 Uncharacterised protein [Actinomadura madurae]
MKIAELALALTARYFPTGQYGEARFEDSAFLLSGQMHYWSDWMALPYAEKQRIGRLLALRPERFANPTVFGRTMKHVLSAERPRLDTFRLTKDGAGARPVLGGDLDGFADGLLSELEAGPPKDGVVQMASAGVWALRHNRDGRIGECVEVTIPEYSAGGSEPAPQRAISAPRRTEVRVNITELLELAGRLDDLRPDRTPYLRATLDKLLAGLREEVGPVTEDLILLSGLLRVLNAPTGTGKSVLMRVLAVHLAQREVRVAVIVPNVEASLGISREIAEDLDLLGRKAECTPLMSPHRLHGRAAKEVERAGREDSWDESTRWRVDRLAYGCALLELLDPGSRPKPGDEPCERLHQPDGRGGLGKEVRSCPWKPTCPKFAQSRAAVMAAVVVTNHHNFLSGRLQVPVQYDGRPRRRMAISEFLLGTFDVVMIDEIDQFQSTAVDVCAKEMPLSSRARWEEIPLKRLDDDRGRIPVRDSLRITPALSRLRVLADQLVNFVADGALRIPGVLPGVHMTKWQLPTRYDRELIRSLFGVPEDELVTEEIYKRLDSLFLDYEPDRGNPRANIEQTGGRNGANRAQGKPGRSRVCPGQGWWVAWDSNPQPTD